MALVTKASLLDYAVAAHVARNRRQAEPTTSQKIMMEDFNQPLGSSFDIFLSHSYLDSNYVVGVKGLLESFGYRVYVDWVEDSLLDRSKVTRGTALLLRERMESSRCLLYATSDHSEYSKWMPWECGYVDGRTGKVAVLPVVDSPQEIYVGQEYLGLYPFIDRTNRTLWVNDSEGRFLDFEDWLNGSSFGN